MTTLKTSALLFSIGAAGLASANAALVITDTDIAANAYRYSLAYADLATATKFTNDIFASSNVSLNIESPGNPTNERRYIRANGGNTSASFTYAFDFTTTSYRPTSMSVLDYVLVNTGSTTVTATATTAYSFDNITWTTIRTRSTSTTNTNSQTSTGTTNISFLETPDVVYYRTTFSITGGTFNATGAQWDRMAPASPAQFDVNFALTAAPIPEPSSFALCAGGLGLGMAALRRRRALR